jgi:hypothetical protein
MYRSIGINHERDVDIHPQDFHVQQSAELYFVKIMGCFRKLDLLVCINNKTNRHTGCSFILEYN